MRRYVCALFICAAALVGCGAAAARQSRPAAAEAPLAQDAPLAETLSWLDARLRKYGRFTLYYSLYEPGLRYRTSFLGLEADGCSVTYRVSYERVGSRGDDVNSPAGGFNRPAVDGGRSVTERVVDLSALDPALVKGKIPKKWDGGMVSFGAGRGKVSVRSPDERGRVREYEGGEFYVSEKEHVEATAEALRRAVLLCRK